MKKIKIFYKQATKFLKKHKSEILLGVSIGGTVAADTLFIYKAKKLYENNDSPTAKNYISAYWLPIVISGGSVAAGICSHNALVAEKMALASLVAFTASRAKSLEKTSTHEEVLEADSKCLNELMIEADAANELEDDCETNGDKQLYYLPQYGIIFWSDETTVRTAELNLNQLFTHEMFATLGDFLTFLGINSSEWDVLGDQYVWRFNYDDVDNGIQYITFEQYQKPLPSGINCNYIYFRTEAMTLDEWQAEYQDCGV